MQPAIDYAHPTTHRRRPWRKILLIAGIVIAVPLVLFGAFIGWFQYEMTRNQVIIMVDNRSTSPVDAMLFDAGAPTPTVALKSVAAGQQADRNQNTWRVIAPATFRVQVGARSYEGEAGILLDDDGPHRFWVKAFDDRVEVTRQSNEDPWDLKMLPWSSATQPAR
jgi:hypothetical protein